MHAQGKIIGKDMLVCLRDKGKEKEKWERFDKEKHMILEKEEEEEATRKKITRCDEKV